ncbi:1106_t:CDS:2 [Dentiscutata heterogama]|uniref:1106_t:CDS:1 n=1 Tax=Dentiscutata heterogama TaxID=1316150 RepID=A0ACA9KM43_9GLOM|nr:1106_t:CDS:2 [Dentiscutata heterogama]
MGKNRMFRVDKIPENLLLTQLVPLSVLSGVLLRPMTNEEISGIMLDSYLTTDTVANTLCYALYYISHHPSVKKKLVEEIKTVFKDDLTRPITLDDLNKLRYCEAVIKESARIRPTFSMISRITSQPEEVEGFK